MSNTEQKETRIDKFPDFHPPEFDGMKLPFFEPLKKKAKERFETIRDMNTREDDILLTAYPRSGTHWTWEIITMLVQGTAEYTEAVKETAFIEMVEDLTPISEMASPRVLNTHIPYRWLPKKHIENGGKIVHVIRNPKDQAVSTFHFIKDMIKPLSDMKWDDYFDMIISGQSVFYGKWSSYENEYEAAQGEANMHIMYYEDLKLNPIKEISRLADFLKIDATENLVKEIADKCHFTKLKEAHQNVKKPNSTAKHYRKGEIGDWKNYFTVAQNERFDALYKTEMAKSNLEVKFEP